MKTLIVIGIIVAVGLIWMWREMKNAPEGYQDKDGFHVGKGEDQ